MIKIFNQKVFVVRVKKSVVSFFHYFCQIRLHVHLVSHVRRSLFTQRKGRGKAKIFMRFTYLGIYSCSPLGILLKTINILQNF